MVVNFYKTFSEEKMLILLSLNYFKEIVLTHDENVNPLIKQNSKLNKFPRFDVKESKLYHYTLIHT